jgi:mRNA-degrading endonuclease HigB of HigAB toxin-antitoxin module
MQLFGTSRLGNFVQEHDDSRIPLSAWQLEVEDAQWKGPDDVQVRYLDAIVHPDRVIFSIKNLYMIDVRARFKQGILLIEKIWTPMVSKPVRSSAKSATLRSKA